MPSSGRSDALSLEVPSSTAQASEHVDLNLKSQTVPASLPGAELSVIVPTFNERKNVSELVRLLQNCLDACSWEVIFVDDDSPDGTADLVREMARQDHRIRCIQRIGRRGLSSACIEGMLASSAPYLAVMDGDLQHDEELLLLMLYTLKQGEEDIVVGSRYVSGGGTEGWDSTRLHLSRFATWISRVVVRADLKDPMSGFFMIRREAFSAAERRLSVIGFKILLDLFASSPQPLRFKELPYQFRNRHEGESKLDSRAKWDYGMLLLDKLIGHLVPVRFIGFTLVGSLGVCVHFVVLTFLFKVLSLGFISSQVGATVIAMTTNFAVNNIVTYRDVQLRGWNWVRGWVVFMLACSVGTVANVGIAAYLFEHRTGWTVAALAGVMVGAVWNYAVTKAYIWRD